MLPKLNTVKPKLDHFTNVTPKTTLAVSRLRSAIQYLGSKIWDHLENFWYLKTGFEVFDRHKEGTSIRRFQKSSCHWLAWFKAMTGFDLMAVENKCYFEKGPRLNPNPKLGGGDEQMESCYCSLCNNYVMIYHVNHRSLNEESYIVSCS